MKGKVVVVTGAAGILGQAVVSCLALRGARVLALDLAPSMPACGQHQYKGNVDLALPIELRSAVAKLALGGMALSGLANIAGAFCFDSVGDGALENWDRMYRTNLRTAVACSQAMLPLLRERGGAIVNVGAQASFRAGAGMGAYTASKSGVTRLTESLAEEEKDRGIRVNAVLPSILDTPLNRKDMPDADYSRWVKPKHLAAVITFLLSSQACAITGASIPVVGRC